MQDVLSTVQGLLRGVQLHGGEKQQTRNERITQALCAAAVSTTRIIAELPPGQQASLAQQLCSPMVSALQAACVSSCSNSPTREQAALTARVVTHNITLLASVAQFLEGKGADSDKAVEHPVLTVRLHH